jgi:hypothetical protein
MIDLLSVYKIIEFGRRTVHNDATNSKSCEKKSIDNFIDVGT